MYIMSLCLFRKIKLGVSSTNIVNRELRIKGYVRRIVDGLFFSRM